MTLGEADDLVCEFAFPPHPGPPSSTSAKVPCESASRKSTADSFEPIVRYILIGYWSMSNFKLVREFAGCKIRSAPLRLHGRVPEHNRGFAMARIRESFEASQDRRSSSLR